MKMLAKGTGNGSGGGAMARTLARYRELKQPVHLGFLIDATASRSHSWEEAQKQQRRMFEASARHGRIAVRLVHFGGGAITDHGTKEGAHELAATMAPVRCVSGMTQFLESLRLMLDAPPDTRPRAIIMVGDTFEEDEGDAAAIITACKRSKVSIYSFLEGEDAFAAHVFRRLAEGTGGRFANLGSDLQLGDLCEGVALLTAGGAQALRRLPAARAKQLLLSGPSTRKG